MLCALIGAGCAGLPRIDPSGERVFLWPQNRAATVQPFSTNPQVPPVYTDAVYPPAVLPAGQTRGGQGLAGLLPPLPTDRLTLTPNRVLAPVGSEVILKAGLCTSENFLLTDSKIEWLLARDEVGEFVSLGGRGLLQNPLLPWNKAKKIDNQYATGFTATVPLRITRGTADPSDDVQVQPGEAWASVTSPVEGTSRITAVAPEIATWAQRRATATIYWVDVQWTFPAAAVSAAGSKVLTTTVRRHTDGTPIVGWLVRYEVADGSGALRNSESGQVVEVPTDSNGQASIDVTPTGSSGTTTIIKTQIVRPERFTGSNAPRLVIANGASTIQWTDGGSDYLPTPDNLDVTPPSYPIPANPVPANPPVTTLRGPKLELEVRTNDGQVFVGQQARFQVTIRNTGDSTATGIVLTDIFDRGLSHLRDPNRYQKISKPLDDIPAGGSSTVDLTFRVNAPGSLNQRLKLTYGQGGSVVKDASIVATQPPQQLIGRLEILEDSPLHRNIGDLAQFKLSLRNVGEAPLTDIEIKDVYDPELLLPRQVPLGAQIVNGSLLWSIPHLGVGETKTFDVECECVQVSAKACRTITVSANTGTNSGVITQSAISCTEIRPRPLDVIPPVTPLPEGNVMPGVNPPAPGEDVAPNADINRPLRMEVLLLGKTVRVGSRATLQLTIHNPTNVDDKEVRLRLVFPAELLPDVTAIQTDANVAAQFTANNGQLLFEVIRELRANERLTFLIPYNVRQQGIREIKTELFSQNMPQILLKTNTIRIDGP